MNREIKFRGKRVDNGEWGYGFLHKWHDGRLMIESNELKYAKNFGHDIHPSYEVITETIGQYTGEKDSESEIYEDDIVDTGYGIGKVVFWRGCFFIQWVDDPEASVEPLGFTKQNRNREVLSLLGNVHEHPELIKQ